MPYLQFEINKKVCNETKEEFAKEIQTAYSGIMNSDTNNIAISLREVDKYNLSLGRANTSDDICFISLDIAEGKTLEQRRELAKSFTSIVKTNFQVDENNQFITFTQHEEEGYHLV